MARELAPIDIRHPTDFAALVEEVWASGKARRIVRSGQELAVLMLAAEATRHRRLSSATGKRQSGDRRSVTDRTAGALKANRLPRPLTPDEERAAFEIGVAEQRSLGTRSTSSVVAATAGVVQYDGPVLTIEEESEAFELTVAAEALESLDD